MRQFFAQRECVRCSSSRFAVINVTVLPFLGTQFGVLSPALVGYRDSTLDTPWLGRATPRSPGGLSPAVASSEESR